MAIGDHDNVEVAHDHPTLQQGVVGDNEAITATNTATNTAMNSPAHVSVPLPLREEEIAHDSSVERQEESNEPPEPIPEPDSNTPAPPVSPPTTMPVTIPPEVPKTQLTFLLVSGKRRTMSFDPDTTIGRVKELVWNAWPSDWQNERPPAPSYLKVLYLGKILQDEDTLTSHKLRPTPAPPTIVHLSIRTVPIPSDTADAIKKNKKRRNANSTGGGENGGNGGDGTNDGDDGGGCCNGCIIS